MAKRLTQMIVNGELVLSTNFRRATQLMIMLEQVPTDNYRRVTQVEIMVELALPYNPPVATVVYGPKWQMMGD